MLALLQRLIDKYNEIQGVRDSKKLCDFLNNNPQATLDEFKVELQKNGYVCVGIALTGSTEIYKKGSKELTLKYVTEEE